FQQNDYHKRVKEAANENVLFLGAIYDSLAVSSLRYFALAYVHGHTVGGTNPSLVESIGCGNAIIAHDNKFNRWVIAESGV
ncbi:glycosyl transferase, partial [Enterobacter hormaechei]|nr:glycosyl transferase [Enterobacter hormaechei]